MSRWVVFDDNTAAAVTAAAHAEPVRRPAADYLDEALSDEKEVVLVMPAELPSTALVAHFRRPLPVPAQEPEKEPAVHYEATGFLGLMDTPVYDDQPQPKKKWWQKIF